MSRVSFGDFVLDLDSRELLQGGQAVALAPKAYQLLEILVTNRPKALSKMALQERLWPDLRRREESGESHRRDSTLPRR